MARKTALGMSGLKMANKKWLDILQILKRMVTGLGGMKMEK